VRAGDKRRQSALFFNGLLEKSGSRFARPGYSRAMREVIAKRIVDMAQQGVTDPQALAEDAVRFVRANYKDDLSGKA
jgi:hypothetical protein